MHIFQLYIVNIFDKNVIIMTIHHTNQPTSQSVSQSNAQSAVFSVILTIKPYDDNNNNNNAQENIPSTYTCKSVVVL